jgi:hypothetical protein
MTYSAVVKGVSLKRTEKEKSDYDKEKQPMNHIRKGDNS